MDPRLIPEINIGTMGHVDHGKSTLVKAITGKWTAQHSEELKRGITIKVGYADATVYKCSKCNIYTTKNVCPKCFEKVAPERTVSFVDAPGHEILMATVLSAASLMDAILFIIAANEKCPQPQTKEHLNILNAINAKNIIVVQTKVDLVSKERALESYKEIKNFLKGSVAENAPIIPVSAVHNINIDLLLKAIQEKFPTPKRDETKPPKMLVVRSFDINKPGTAVKDLCGGILGGGIIQGKLKVGDRVEILPGVQQNDKWHPLETKVIGLQKAGMSLDEAGPGGLLGVMTTLDPALTKADSLAGSVCGKELPQPRVNLDVKIVLFKETVSGEKIEALKVGEALMINVGTAKSLATVKKYKKSIASLALKIPVVCDAGEKIVLSRKIQDRWRLIGYGVVQ